MRDERSEVLEDLAGGLASSPSPGALVRVGDDGNMRQGNSVLKSVLISMVLQEVCSQLRNNSAGKKDRVEMASGDWLLLKRTTSPEKKGY